MMDWLKILTWLASGGAVLLCAACLVWIGWEEYVRWQEKKERRAVHAAMRASFQRRRDEMGDTLIDHVHQAWDPVDTHGPRRTVRKWR